MTSSSRMAPAPPVRVCLRGPVRIQTLLQALVTVAILAAPASARASARAPFTLATPLPANLLAFANVRAPLRLEWNVGAFFSRVGLPSALISQPAAVTTTRNYSPGARLPLPTANFSLVSLGTSFVIGDRWVVPLFQASVGAPIGPSPTAATAFDGDPALVSLRSAFRTDFGILGIGVRGNARRWSGGIRVVPTVVVVGGVRATVPDGLGTADLAMNTLYFGLRAEFEGCRRIDPRARVCVVGAPSLFDGRPFNGFTFGFRMDLGL